MLKVDKNSKVFAVSFFDMGTNELHTQIIYAHTWQRAAIAHSKSPFAAIPLEDGSVIPETDLGELSIEEVKVLAFDADGGFDVVELSVDDDKKIFVVPQMVFLPNQEGDTGTGTKMDAIDAGEDLFG